MKEDLDCSAAELDFGTPFSLPRQYFSPCTNYTPMTDFARELQHKMAKLAYTPTRYQSTDVYVPHHQVCKFVFIRNEAIRYPLTPMYVGLSRSLILQINIWSRAVATQITSPLNRLNLLLRRQILEPTLHDILTVWFGWVGLGWVLWHINHCRLFNAKSSLYIYIKYIWFGLVGFYGISTIVGYLMPNPLYTYILNIYDLVWLGFMAYQPL